jgi:hypothetical protein
LRLKHATSLTLMQGPITVLAGGIYAEDGPILRVPVDAKREARLHPLGSPILALTSSVFTC